MIFLGIDTSCYTTSVAAVNENGQLISQKRRLLSVAEGERGLRQSEAFFKHVNNFPDLYRELLESIDPKEIAAVCVSTQPRGLSHSYMPVFFAGRRIAESIAMSLNVPLFATDHQSGHLEAALYQTDLTERDFCAVHLSGGTTEVLEVKENRGEHKIRQIAASKDINAGQLIDRLGVKMGMNFPAGKEVDKLAVSYSGERMILPISADLEGCSFSGTEAAAIRALEAGCDPAQLCESLLSAIARTLAKMVGSAAYYAGLNTILMAGGVSSSQYLREHFVEALDKRGMNPKVVFSSVEFSSDNAVGVALLCRKKYMNREGNV